MQKYPDFKLDIKIIENLEYILQDIEKWGRSVTCPNWNHYNKGSDCATCESLFPKIKIASLIPRCPCDVYTPTFLIKRLKDIINHCS